MKAPLTRHVISINDLSNKDIETIFEVAQSFLDELPDPNFSYRIGRSTDLASSFILASLFYEPSTRTRLSFESAMLRLGGDTITSADPATSSAAKGESLADTVRVIANYADLIVIRHPRDGAARLAADYSPIPVINGGDWLVTSCVSKRPAMAMAVLLAAEPAPVSARPHPPAGCRLWIGRSHPCRGSPAPVYMPL